MLKLEHAPAGVRVDFLKTRGLSQYKGKAVGGCTDPGRQTFDPLLGNPYKKPPESWVIFRRVRYGFFPLFLLIYILPFTER